MLLIYCHLGEIMGRAVSNLFENINMIMKLLNAIVGMNFNSKTAEITAELYNMPWYVLSVNTQRQVRSAIHMIQNGGSLTIGPLSTLNMETAKEVIFHS